VRCEEVCLFEWRGRSERRWNGEDEVEIWSLARGMVICFTYGGRDGTGNANVALFSKGLVVCLFVGCYGGAGQFYFSKDALCLL